MIRKWMTYGLLLLVLGLTVGCGKSGEKGLGENELVRINDVSITPEEFRQMLERQSLEGKIRLLSEEGQRDFLENYVITREVFYQEAVKKGLDKNKDIMTKVEDFRRAMVIDALLEEALRGKGEVTDKDIEHYYKENQDRFFEPVEVKIRHIFVTSEPVMKEVLSKLSKGEKFEKVASAYNEDKSREDGGNLGYIRRGQLTPAFAQFEDAAFSLKEKGAVSEVIKTPYGYHVLQLEDAKGKILRPLAQVKEKIRFFLQAKKKHDAYLDYVKEAKSKGKILINEKLWAEQEKKGAKPKEEKK